MIVDTSSAQIEQKRKELLQKRQETVSKLKELYKHFRGVRHENSASEIRYTQIRVLESFIESIDAELKSLENVENK